MRFILTAALIFSSSQAAFSAPPDDLLVQAFQVKEGRQEIALPPSAFIVSAGQRYDGSLVVWAAVAPFDSPSAKPSVVWVTASETVFKAEGSIRYVSRIERGSETLHVFTNN